MIRKILVSVVTAILFIQSWCKASEPIVRITEPLSFMITNDYRIIMAKDYSMSFVLQCPGYTANQLKEKFLVALNDLNHMSDYYGTKLHHTIVHADESSIKFTAIDVPVYTESYNVRNVPLSSVTYVQTVQHRFRLQGDITIEFRDGRIKISTPQDASIHSDLYVFDIPTVKSYLECKDRPIHYAVNHKKLFEQRYEDLTKAVTDMYMELFDAVNNRSMLLLYRNSVPKTIKISETNNMLFHITPNGEIINTVSSRPYIDVLIPVPGMSKMDCIKSLRLAYQDCTIDEFNGGDDEVKVTCRFDAGDYNYEYEWLYIFYDTYVRVFPPRVNVIRTTSIGTNEFYHTLKSYLLCQSYIDIDKNEFKKTKKAKSFIDGLDKISNMFAFQYFLKLEAAYKQSIKENQW